EADPVVVLLLDRPAKARGVEPPSAPQVSDAQRDDGYVRIHRLLLGKVQDHSTNVCSYHPGSIANVLLSRAVLAIFSLNLRVRVPTLSLATGGGRDGRTACNRSSEGPAGARRPAARGACAERRRLRARRPDPALHGVRQAE